MNQTILQVILITVSVLVAVMVVKPTLQDMGSTQQETAEYITAIENAAEANSKLSDLYRQVNSFSSSEEHRLALLVPEKIDAVQIAYDLEVMTNESGMFLTTLTVNDEVAEVDPVSNTVAEFGAEDEITAGSAKQIATQDFVLELAGTYDQFKDLLTQVETSARLLDIVDTKFTESDTDLLEFSLIIRAYGLNPSPNALSKK